MGTRYLNVGLGVAPAIPVVLGTAAAAAAIGGLLGLIQNAMDDAWADTSVFRSHAREIHSAMLAIQCMLGGAEQPLNDSLGNQICPGGTAPGCRLSSGQLVEWRSLRDGFAAFWADTTQTWSMRPTNAEAARLKAYAREFYAFYLRISKVCRAQGAQLPSAPALPDASKPVPAPAWLKWTIGGVAIVSLAIIVRAVTRA